ncbi:MAG: exo-alpha-sialidase [Candidatus Omnitrophica bacterium]|nr:MAG: Sialidase precursor [Candidatus Hinthialibacteria bacterium OLB16]MBW7938850.1 exo-alpha-sialidase [Candidatus Omnitrophota bacterium]MCK6495805.1 glycoside hydrolase [bacterium]NUP93682.1 exo-alpha-sialidase [Candidatus Omnitrophota bacterium]
MFFFRKVLPALFISLLPTCLPCSAHSDLQTTDVYVSGQDGYHCYRIPGIECTPDGTLLAFAEARKNHCGDPGTEGNDIDLVLKRSTDQGKTWSPMAVIEDPGANWSAANPATCVDRTTGKIWVLYIRTKPGRDTHSSRPGTDDAQVLARSSDDQGLTWSQPLDLTADTRDMKDPQWTITVVGPGGMIQDSKGRLAAAAWKTSPWGNFAVFSDDHGNTWKRGQVVPGSQGGDENQLVELANGQLLMDFRQSKGPHRWMSQSLDGGQTWPERREGLPVTPVCCAIERLTLKSKGSDKDRILWTGPRGPDRHTLVARISYDEGMTFPDEFLIADEPAAYSDLTLLKDGSAGVLWERGDYKYISFTRLPLEFFETPENK